MAQELPHVSMHPRVTFADDRMRLICKDTTIIEIALHERLMPLAESIDVPPRGCCVKR